MSVPPVIVGHRGAAGLAPENTLAGFRAAGELGIRTMELDVRLTRDGQLAVIHDPTVDRTTRGVGRVAELCLAEIQALPRRRGQQSEGCRIPSLREALAALGPGVHWRIELKPEDQRPEELVAAVLATIRAARCRRRVRLISFQASLLHLLRARDPAIPLGALEARDPEAAFETAARCRCEALMLETALVSAPLVERCHAGGLLIAAWTANQPAEIRRLADLGVDEIITDYPDRALAVLAGG
jgi:glycerophosphoryl diester phosphodiesterase